MRQEIYNGIKEFAISIAAYLAAFLATLAFVGAVELITKLFQ